MGHCWLCRGFQEDGVEPNQYCNATLRRKCLADRHRIILWSLRVRAHAAAATRTA
jgi:hypothetical protein